MQSVLMTCITKTCMRLSGARAKRSDMALSAAISGAKKRRMLLPPTTAACNLIFFKRPYNFLHQRSKFYF